MVAAIASRAGERREHLRGWIPSFGRINRTTRVIETRSVTAAGDENFSVRQYGRVELPPSIGHRTAGTPVRRWLIEVDHLGRCDWRIVAADQQDLSRLVHPCRPIVPETAGALR